MNRKLLVLMIGMFLLVGAFGSVSAIDNFNISSSISSAPLFFLNGTSGDASFGFNVTAGEDFCLESGLCLSNLALSKLNGTLNSVAWNRTGTNVFLANTGDSVGIGTASPGTLLHAYKTTDGTVDVKVENPNTGTSARSGIISSSDVVDLRMLAYSAAHSTRPAGAWIGTISNHNLTLASNNLARITIDTSGNVGIGSTAPSAKLFVYDSSTLPVARFASTGTNGTYLQFDEQGTKGWFAGINDGDTSFNIKEDSITGSSRFTIKAGGNVGIGTATPQNKLNVIGDGNFTGTVYSGGSAVLTSYSETDPKWTGNLTLVPFLASANTFTNNNVFNQNLTVDTNTFFVNSNTNNVGIGTTSPGAKLDVSSTKNNSNLILRTSAAMNTLNDYQGISFYDSTTETGRITSYINDLAGGEEGLSFWTFDSPTLSQKMTILGNGNVGIGTTSPGQKLVVSGTGDVSPEVITTSSTNAAGLKLTGGTQSWGIFSQGSAGVTPGGLGIYDYSGTPGYRMVVASGGNVGIGTTSPQNKLNVIGDGNFTGTVYSNGVALSTTTGTLTGSGTANYLSKWNGTTSQTNSVIYDDGTNVGIGTTGPNANLQVGGTTTFPVLKISDTTTYNSGILSFGDGQSTGNYVGVWRGAENSVSSVANWLNLGGYDGIALTTGNAALGSQTERVTILSTGNVGIGTTAPQSKFEISRTESDTNGVANSHLVLQGTTNAAYRWQERLDTSGNLHFDTNYSAADVTRVSFLRSGNVGIGTTNPQTELHLNDSTGLSKIRLEGGAVDATTFELAQGNTGVSNGGFEIRDVTAGANRLTIDSSGNVGIGTTVPGAKLAIGTLASGTGQGNLYIQSDTNHRAIHLEENSGGESWQIGVSAEGNLNFMDSGGAAGTVTFQDGGNVGIGTTSPAQKLDVAGNIALTHTSPDLYFNVTGGTKYSWMIAAQENVDNTLEITPSTTVGGSTFSTPAISVKYDGKVGIGTASPQNKLNVIGDGNFTGTVYSGGSAVLTSYSETDPKWTGNLTLVPFLASANTFTNNNVFNQNLTVDTNTFFVNSNTNNVGIGTTSPDKKLTLSANSVIGFEYNTAGSGSYHTITGGGLNPMTFYWGPASGDYVAYNFSTNNIPSGALVIKNNGNVGIGTSSPSGLLHLKDDFTSGVATIYDRTENAAVDNLFYTGVSTLGTTATDFMWMGTATSDLVIKGNGNVGIGTTSPGAKLEVVGTFNATSNGGSLGIDSTGNIMIGL